jgi:hypothetical protein
VNFFGQIVLGRFFQQKKWEKFWRMCFKPNYKLEAHSPQKTKPGK